MFYNDSSKDFTILSTGKQATTSMHQTLSRVYKAKVPLVDSSLELYHPKHEPSIPCYIINPITYVEFRNNSTVPREHYIVIREPQERLVSGIVENIFTYYWDLDEPFSGDLDSIPDHLFELDDYHVCPYLSHLTPVIDNSIFVNMPRLSELALKKLNCPLLLTHTNRRKSLRSPMGLVTGNDMCEYVNQRILDKTIPLNTQCHLMAETSVYNFIINSCNVML